MPITSDGCFLAYKAVSNDFHDLWSHSIDNSVGSTPEVPRDKVDSNRDRGCSNGLHVGAIDYAAQYGGIDLKVDDEDGGGGNNIVIAKVNPRDVVSVPTCSRYQKLRCCKYEVVSEEWKEEITAKLVRVKEVLGKVNKYATV